MGLSTKQVSVDQELDWSSAVLQSGTLELPEPTAPARRQQNPLQSEPLKCPRCDSINTKFCYYNNYNKSQPRHFCKACKRHWTKGGTLRNVPVGGGRKNKRIKRFNSAAGGSNRPKNQMGTQSQPQFNDQPLIRSPLLQNDSINSFTAKILGNNGGGFMGLSLPLPQNQGLQFSFSSLSNFDTNTSSSSIPYFQSSVNYKYEPKLEAVDDPAITNLMANTSSSIIEDNQTWEVPSASTNLMELPDYWNWNDMVSADLNIPWDDDDDDDDENRDNQP